MKVYNTHINFLKLSGIETLWKWADSVPIFKSLFWMHTFLTMHDILCEIHYSMLMYTVGRSCIFFSSVLF